MSLPAQIRIQTATLSIPGLRSSQSRCYDAIRAESSRGGTRYHILNFGIPWTCGQLHTSAIL